PLPESSPDIVFGMKVALAGVLLGALPLWSQEDHQQHEHMVAGLGSVNFANSCAPSAQAPFARAIALLHSFGYEEARSAFADAATADPACAMAQWGVAMT